MCPKYNKTKWTFGGSIVNEGPCTTSLCMAFRQVPWTVSCLHRLDRGQPVAHAAPALLYFGFLDPYATNFSGGLSVAADWTGSPLRATDVGCHPFPCRAQAAKQQQSEQKASQVHEHKDIKLKIRTASGQTPQPYPSPTPKFMRTRSTELDNLLVKKKDVSRVEGAWPSAPFAVTNKKPCGRCAEGLVNGSHP